MKKSILVSFLSLFLFFVFSSYAFARQPESISDWYIKSFKSSIVVGQDSSLLITEKIVADCGNLPNKHGIFRVLPTTIKRPSGEVSSPVTIISITDFSGKPLKYSTSKKNNTITWKIGDPNVVVNGENEYQIVYRVDNVIFFQENIDELYWNLNGNFWEMEIDDFSADLIFPKGLNEDDVKLEYFTGKQGGTKKDLVSFGWTKDYILHFQSERVFLAGEGVTVAVGFPKGYINEPEKEPVNYAKTFFESLKYFFVSILGYLNNDASIFLWLVLPVLCFFFCFIFWNKYGRDPVLSKTVIPEYEPPYNLGPLEIGMLEFEGALKSRFVTAAIIQLAVKGYIKISKDKTKYLIFEKIKEVDVLGDRNLTMAEKQIFLFLFGGGPMTSSLNMANNFYIAIKDIKTAGEEELAIGGYMERKGFALKKTFISFGFGLAIFVFFVGFQFGLIPIRIVLSLAACGLVVSFFGFYMTKMTPKGVEAEWKIKGFKMFIDKAEKYRAQFYEKEEMFEKILPYAIAFGVTKKWIKQMKSIYGTERFNAIAPIWFYSSAGFISSLDSFTASLDKMTTAISSRSSSGSGFGGGGFSGGGGGGGGGGGW
jgi:uncharacterized membrane protein